MPRVSRAQTELNRSAIEEASARLFREQGLHGVSVEALMSAAGLTHGGFYGHFASKDEVAAVACQSAFGQSKAVWARRIASASSPAEARRQIAANYLSARHMSSWGQACPLASLAVDVAREPAGKPVRAAFLAGVKDLVEMLSGLCTGRTGRTARAQALAQLATMVGAVVLARATQGAPLSEEFLESARAALLESGGEAS
jgi:TetR/AcrR family transcriptional repressor of nem operon